MPVSHTKRVGQVGTLFSSLFHLKYPKQCFVNSMKATVLAAKRILLHLPNTVNSSPPPPGILIKTIDSVVDIYTVLYFILPSPSILGREDCGIGQIEGGRCSRRKQRIKTQRSDSNAGLSLMWEKGTGRG